MRLKNTEKIETSEKTDFFFTNFSKIAFSKVKVTTYFENCAKRQLDQNMNLFFFFFLHGPPGYTLQSKFSTFCYRKLHAIEIIVRLGH